ncbi:MAG: hypothetical protein ACRCSQ_01745 [Bacteroidales bacterium]
MKIIILFISTILLFASCNNSKEKASLLLEEARDMFESGALNQAKLRIDSMRSTFPKEFDLINEGRQLMREIELKENERNLAYADSLLIIKLAEAEELKKGFVFDKAEGYEELGNYIPKGLTVERNIERNYIRTGVNEYGEMYIASVYFGKGNINHTGIKVEVKDGSHAQTLSIPYDGGNNYRFSDNGNQSEIVTYKKEKDNGVAGFINHYKNERIKVSYTGGKPYVIYLDDQSKKAIINTYELAMVLSDITRLGQEKKVAEGKIAFLKKRILEKADSGI